MSSRAWSSFPDILIEVEDELIGMKSEAEELPDEGDRLF